MNKATNKKVRGVYEHPPGSGIWWVQHFDCDGRRHREKVGTKSAAINQHTKRRAEALNGKKFPENIRRRSVLFSEIAKDALQHSKQDERSYYTDTIRMARLVKAFGDRGAESITRGEIASWLNQTAEERKWSPATKNRYLALLKLTFRLAEEKDEREKGRITVNPTRLLRLKKEENDRDRYLNQFKPLPTKLPYLKDCHDEESRIRTVISTEYPHHLPEFEIALHTGMRASEQYRLRWTDVNFERKQITARKTKNGKTRHLPLNTTALAVLEFLQTRAPECDYVFLGVKGERLLSNRHWFPKAVGKAGLRDFGWHCLRHTFASRLAMAGVSLKRIKELMGHESIQMTDRYAHLTPATAEDVEKLVTRPPTATVGATGPESTVPADLRKVQ